MIPKVKYKAPHQYDYDEESRACTIKDFGPSMTVQSMADDVDLNVIMERFGVTGKMPEFDTRIFYGDFDGIVDFRSAQDAINDAMWKFNSMPAAVRARFGNDPQQFLDFCSDEGNLPELRKMGLAIPEKAEVESGRVEADVAAEVVAPVTERRSDAPRARPAREGRAGAPSGRPAGEGAKPAGKAG